jgi:cytochrome bd-type quinol oxidase subunit 2
MWQSWGDNYEIVRYDKNKRPRKIKGVYFVVIGLLILMIPTAFIENKAGIWQYVPTIIVALEGVVCLVMFALKWFKNDHEYDALLLFVAIVFFIAAYLMYPKIPFEFFDAVERGLIENPQDSLMQLMR